MTRARRQALRGGSAAIVALAAAATAAQSPPAQPLRVVVHATVVDAAGRPLPGLTAADFEILEDEQPRAIAGFAAGPHPIASALLLDMNGPPVEVPWLRDAALGFVDALVPGDRVRLGTFGDEIFLSPRLTDDRAYLHRVLHEELWPAGVSPLWEGLDAAIASLREVPGRRTVVVVSNGYHLAAARLRTVSSSGVLDLAVQSGVGVFVVTFADVTIDRSLRLLAERTGGRLAVIKDLSFAPQALAEIAGELRGQYRLEFEPARADADVHEVLVRVTRKGAMVRAATRHRAGGRK